MKQFTIGCDPEAFMLDSNGKYKSVIGMIGGSKDKPRIISGVGHAILEDNVAVEFNIPPCNSFESFRNEIRFTMEKIKELLPELQFSTESAVSFPDQELQTPDAWVFGCEPDFNAWTNSENEKPFADDINLRSAGGHIHVGTDLDKNEVIKAMDLFLGIPSIELDTNGTNRRALYGKAGACRYKPYGVEYRTLSNFWIFKDELIEWAYIGTQKALNFVASGNNIGEKDGKEIQEAINTSNKQMAWSLRKRWAI